MPNINMSFECGKLNLGRAMLDNKKSSIILILRILEEYSDEDHFLTQREIIEKIDTLYGISLERKSVSYSISLLQELGYDIEKSPKGGYALFSRLFDYSEARFMEDALFSSRSITGKQALSLTKRIESTFSRHHRKKHAYLYKSNELSRTPNKDVFFNIDLIEEGIERGKRVSFRYKGYDEEGNPCYRMDGYKYIVSPYYLINNFGRYYLLCNYKSKYRPFHVFRVDYMADMAIEESWPIKPLNTLEGTKDFDIADFINEHVYLFSGETVKAKLRIEKPGAIQILDDWFGSKARIKKEEGQLIAYLTCDADALFYWILQYGEEFTLLSPDSLIERLKRHIEGQSRKYGD